MDNSLAELEAWHRMMLKTLIEHVDRLPEDSPEQLAYRRIMEIMRDERDPAEITALLNKEEWY